MMRLGDVVGLALKNSLPVIRRWILGLAVIAICAVAALIELTSAARHFLEPAVGPVWARVIIAAAFLLIAAIAAIVMLGGNVAKAERSSADAADPMKQRFSILAEAVGLGFSLGRDFRKAGPNGKNEPAADPNATGAESETSDEPFRRVP